MILSHHSRFSLSSSSQASFRLSYRPILESSSTTGHILFFLSHLSFLGTSFFSCGASLSISQHSSTHISCILPISLTSFFSHINLSLTSFFLPRHFFSYVIFFQSYHSVSHIILSLKSFFLSHQILSLIIPSLSLTSFVLSCTSFFLSHHSFSHYPHHSFSQVILPLAHSHHSFDHSNHFPLH